MTTEEIIRKGEELDREEERKHDELLYKRAVLQQIREMYEKYGEIDMQNVSEETREVLAVAIKGSKGPRLDFA